MKCFINTHKKIFVNSVNMPLKQKISVDYGTEPTMEMALLDKCGKPFEIPAEAEFYLAGDVDFNQETPHCFFSMNYTISGHVITFNINTYSEAFLTKVKNPDTSMVVEVGMTVNEKSTVLLQDEILAQPRVYAEGQPIGGIVLPDVTVTADTMLKDVTALNTVGRVVTGNISDAVITTDETNGLTVSVSRGYVADDEIRVFNPSVVTYSENQVTISKGWLNEDKAFQIGQGIFYNLPPYRATSVKIIPENLTADWTDFSNMFSSCRALTSIPALNTSNGTNFQSMFGNCAKLTTIPALDTSNGTSFSSMFSGCNDLTTIPALDTSNGTNFNFMFSLCYALTSVPELDTSNGTGFQSMFNNCQALTTIPALDTSNGTNFQSMFGDCRVLTTIPALDTSKCGYFNSMFSGCRALTSIPALDTSNGTSFSSMFNNCTSLTNFGGLLNAKKSFSLSASTKLTHDSLLNVLNGLYDLTGTTSQTLTLGSTNLAKLTDAEKAIATNKNWTLA